MSQAPSPVIVYYTLTPAAYLPRVRRFAPRERLLLHLIAGAHYTSLELARLLALSPAETLLALRYLRMHGLVKPVLSLEDAPTVEVPAVSVPAPVAPKISLWKRSYYVIRSWWVRRDS